MFRRVFTCRSALSSAGIKQVTTAADLQTAKPYSEIPKIPTVPLLGAGWAYLPYIGKYKITALHHASMSKYKEYGPILREEVNRDVSALHVFEVEDIEKVFRHEGKTPYRRPLMCLKEYREDRKDLYENIGLFVSNNEEWYKVRTHVQPHMMKPKAIHAYLNVMDDVAKEQVERTLLLRKGNGGEVKDYLNELYKWALESIGVVALDTRLGCLDANPNEEATKMITVVSDILMQALKLEFSPLPMWKYFNTPMKKKFYQNLDYFTETVHKNLALAKKRLENITEDHEVTFLELLMSTTKDPRHITTLITDMFMAGIDTTSTTVGLTLYHLARNRKQQEKVYQEIKSVLREKGMTVEGLNDMKYLKACVKESMRLTPVTVGNGRTIQEDMILRGYHIPAGTMVAMQTTVVMQNEKYFKEPKLFRPERFLREESTHDPFAFLPFGFGPRSCVGRRIAEQELWIMLIRILERFRVEYRHGEVDLVTRLINTPDKPLDFQFFDRLNNK